MPPRKRGSKSQAQHQGGSSDARGAAAAAAGHAANAGSSHIHAAGTGPSTNAAPNGTRAARSKRTARGSQETESLFPLLQLPTALLLELIVPHLGPWSRAQLRATCKEVFTCMNAVLPSMLHGCMVVDGHLAGPMRTTRAQAARLSRTGTSPVHAAANSAAAGQSSGSPRRAYKAARMRASAGPSHAHDQPGVCSHSTILHKTSLMTVPKGRSLEPLCGLLSKGVGRIKGLQLVLAKKDTWGVTSQEYWEAAADVKPAGKLRDGIQCAWVAAALQQLGRASEHSLTSLTLVMGEDVPLSPAVLAAISTAWPRLQALQLVVYHTTEARVARGGLSWEQALATLPATLETLELHITGYKEDGSSPMLQTLSAAAHLHASLKVLSVLEATDFGVRTDVGLLRPLLAPPLPVAADMSNGTGTQGQAGAPGSAGVGMAAAAAAGGAVAAGAAGDAHATGAAAPAAAGSIVPAPAMAASGPSTSATAAAAASPSLVPQAPEPPLTCLDLACHKGDDDVQELLLRCPNLSRLALLQLPHGMSLVDFLGGLPKLTSLRLTDAPEDESHFDSLNSPPTVQALNCLTQLSLAIETVLALKQALGEPGAVAPSQPSQLSQSSGTGLSQLSQPAWHGCLSHLQLLELYSEQGDLYIEQVADVLPMVSPYCRLVLRYNALDVDFDVQMEEQEGRSAASQRAIAALTSLARHPGGVHMWAPCNIDLQCCLPANPDAQGELLPGTCCVGAFFVNMALDGGPEERAAVETFLHSLRGMDLQPDLFEVVATLAELEMEQPDAQALDPSQGGHPEGTVAGKAPWLRSMLQQLRLLVLNSIDYDSMVMLVGMLSSGWFGGLEQIMLRLSDDLDEIGEGFGAVVLGLFTAVHKHSKGARSIQVLLRPHQPHHGMALRHLADFVRARIPNPDDLAILH